MRFYTTSTTPQRSPRSERWRSVILPYLLLTTLILAGAICFGIVVTIYGYTEPNFTCLPNGEIRSPWQYYETYYAAWDTSQFLSITLGFGHFTFPAAKTIDIIWDVVVGRVGQALLAYLCYPLFRAAFMRVMESEVSFRVFAAMAFDKMSIRALSTFGSLFIDSVRRRQQAKNSNRTARRNWRFVLIAVAFTYLLALPTMLSAMTGYQAKMRAYVKNPNDNSLMPAAGWTTPAYVGVDGSRIGLADNFPIYIYGTRATWNGTDLNATDLYLTLVGCYAHAFDETYHEINPFWRRGYIGSDNPYFSSTSNYTYIPPGGDGTRCSFNVAANGTHLNDTLSSMVNLGGEKLMIPAPVLDIEPNTVPGSGSDVVADDQTYLAQYYAFGNVSLDWTYIARSSSCEPVTTYQWGFSSLPLFIFFLLSVVFGAVLVVLQQDTYRNGRAPRGTESATNVYRDVLDLAEELKSRLGEEVQRMPPGELKRTVESQGGGVRVDAECLVPSRKEERRANALQTSEPRRRWGGFKAMLRVRSTGASSSLSKQELIGEERGSDVALEYIDPELPRKL